MNHIDTILYLEWEIIIQLTWWCWEKVHTSSCLAIGSCMYLTILAGKKYLNHIVCRKFVAREIAST